MTVKWSMPLYHRATRPLTYVVLDRKLLAGARGNEDVDLVRQRKVERLLGSLHSGR